MAALCRCFQRVSKNTSVLFEDIRVTSFIGTRGKTLWTPATRQQLYKRRLEAGPEKPKHRSEWSNWNLDAEIYAFGKRLGEEFDDDILKTAFIHRSYIDTQESEEGSEDEEQPEVADNEELALLGSKTMSAYIKAYLQHQYPKLCEEGIEAVHSFLTSEEKLSYISENLGTKDIILCDDFPPGPTQETLSKTFQAIIGALVKSQGIARAGLFVQDFVLTELIGEDINNIFNPTNPMGLLVDILEKEGREAPESRLLWKSGQNTYEAIYHVGLYSNKELIGRAPGESAAIAEQMAARDALARIFETTEDRKPLAFGNEGRTLHQDIVKQLEIPVVKKLEAEKPALEATD